MILGGRFTAGLPKGAGIAGLRWAQLRAPNKPEPTRTEVAPIFTAIS